MRARIETGEIYAEFAHKVMAEGRRLYSDGPLGLDLDLYTFIQILSVYAFEKVPLPQLLAGSAYTLESGDTRNQFWLFDL